MSLYRPGRVVVDTVLWSVIDVTRSVGFASPAGGTGGGRPSRPQAGVPAVLRVPEPAGAKGSPPVPRAAGRGQECQGMSATCHHRHFAHLRAQMSGPLQRTTLMHPNLACLSPYGLESELGGQETAAGSRFGSGGKPMGWHRLRRGKDKHPRRTEGYRQAWEPRKVA